MAIDWLNMDTKIWSYTGNQNKEWRMVRVRAGAYLGSKRVMRYHEMGLVHKNECKIHHMHHQTKSEITNGTHDISLKFIFILSKTSLMLGPHQSPIYLAWISPTNSIILELWKKIIHTYLKSRKMENYFKIKENLWKCLPERKCGKFIKKKMGFLVT